MRIPGRMGQARPELLKNIRTVAQNRLVDAKIAWLPSKWSQSDSESSLKSDLHLDEEENETVPQCCQEHFALSMVPTYSNKPDWVHVLPIPDLKRYVKYSVIFRSFKMLLYFQV